MKSEQEQIIYQEYLGHLRDQNLRKSELAVELGIHRNTIYLWEDNARVVPGYVLAYLRMRKKNLEIEQRFRELRSAWSVFMDIFVKELSAEEKSDGE